jgi:hypothetical protein
MEHALIPTQLGSGFVDHCHWPLPDGSWRCYAGGGVNGRGDLMSDDDRRRSRDACINVALTFLRQARCFGQSLARPTTIDHELDHELAAALQLRIRR